MNKAHIMSLWKLQEYWKNKDGEERTILDYKTIHMNSEQEYDTTKTQED